MDSHHEERISQLLGELRENESSSSVSDDSRTQASTSACRDWYDAPPGKQNHEHPDGGLYTNNGDEGTACLDSLLDNIGQKPFTDHRPFTDPSFSRQVTYNQLGNIEIRICTCG